MHFPPKHPFASTLGVKCIPIAMGKFPNFTGHTLPRKDQGDREFYCLTMLTLFQPWRTGHDLKTAKVSWDEAFSDHPFMERQKILLKNMNICHECIDAKDDYYAQLKQGAETETTWVPDGEDGDDSLGDDSALNSVEFVDVLMTKELGRRTLGRLRQIEVMQHILTTLGWSKQVPDLVLERIQADTIASGIFRTGAEWQTEILSMRVEALEKNAPICQESARLKLHLIERLM